VDPHTLTFVAREGPVTFRHFDLYAQALAGIEHGHDTDRRDVAAMIERGPVVRSRLRGHFDAIPPDACRFPAIDPASFRAAVAAVIEP
jgi:hypothetical protein